MEKNIHQIWVGAYEMPNREKRYVDELRKKNPSWNHYLWTNDNLPTDLSENIVTLMEAYDKQKDYAHQADILRIYLVAKYGGIYLDVDFECINGFEDSGFENYEALFCYHGGNDYTMPNGIFGCQKESPIANYLLNNVDIKKGGWYGPSWLGDNVKSFFNVPRDTHHDEVAKIMELNNFKYLLFHELEKNNFKHNALYSWSPENKRNFESGNINYLP
jgi:hypothetical protein